MSHTSEKYRFPALEKLYKLLPEGFTLNIILWAAGIEIETEGEVLTTGPLIAAFTDHISQIDNAVGGKMLLRQGRRQLHPVAKGWYWNRPGYRDILDATFPAGAYFTRTDEEKASSVPSTFADRIYENVTSPSNNRFQQLWINIRNMFDKDARQKPSRHTAMIYPKGSRDASAENQMGIFRTVARLYLGDHSHPGINVPIQPITISNMLPDLDKSKPALHQGEITSGSVVSLIKAGIKRSLMGQRHKIHVKIHPPIEPNELALKEYETTDRLALQLMVEFEKYA